MAETAPPRVRLNLVRQRAISERIGDLMRRYTDPQLTSAEVIAELIEMAKEVAAEGNRGKLFSRRYPRTNWHFAMRWPPTNQPLNYRARTCSLRLRVNSS